MTDWITNSVGEAFSALWQKVYYYVTFQFLDPFWGWLCIAVLLILGLLAIAFFFGSYFPVMRPVIGAMTLMIVGGLIAYRKGESEARAHDAARPGGKKVNSNGTSTNDRDPNTEWTWPQRPNKNEDDWQTRG